MERLAQKHDRDLLEHSKMSPADGRTNEEWLAALRGPEQAVALEDLRGFLTRGLGYALSADPSTGR